MVINKLKISVVGAILTTIFYHTAIAQENSKYSVLNKYCKFGLTGGVSLYNRANIYPKYGDYTFKNRPLWSYNIGLEYDFYPEKKWSFTTGLWIAKEPMYNIKFRILQNDLYSHFTEDLVENYSGYAIHTFSVPMLLRYNLRASENIYLNFYSGLKAMYFPPGSTYFGQAISSLELNETREIFGLKLESQDFSYYGSFVIGTGATFVRKKALIKAKLIYVMNFQNTVNGEYQFGNMISSPPAGGTYKLSGNYMSFLITANLKKKKDPLVKLNVSF